MSDRKLAQLKELLAGLTPAELQQAAALIEDKRTGCTMGTTEQGQPKTAEEQEDPWKTLERIGRELSANLRPAEISLTEQLSRDRSARDWS